MPKMKQRKKKMKQKKRKGGKRRRHTFLAFAAKDNKGEEIHCFFLSLGGMRK